MRSVMELAGDDRWFVEAVEAEQDDSTRIVNEMADRLDHLRPMAPTRWNSGRVVHRRMVPSVNS